MSEESVHGATGSRSEADTAGTRASGTTLAVARYEAERLVVPALLIAVALSLFGSLYVWVGADLLDSIDVDQMTEALPPALRSLFGLESLGSTAGLLASEYYTLGWIVGLAAYVAYVGAGRVAGDIATDRMDMLLAAPAARSRVLLGKYLALFVPILVVNAVVPLALYGVSLAFGDPLSLGDLLAFHALAVPYLLVWGAVGLLLGVVVDGGRTAGRVAFGVVFVTWFVEAIVAGSDYEWVGALTPARYLDPTAILVRGEYGLDGVAVLLAATLVVLFASVVAFRRRDV